ncbi:hypothetical protein [Aeromicrobium sp. P5_D10]
MPETLLVLNRETSQLSCLIPLLIDDRQHLVDDLSRLGPAEQIRLSGIPADRKPAFTFARTPDRH